jgi:ATP-dependent exoDNAse (exonuclease V) alpha subunit
MCIRDSDIIDIKKYYWNEMRNEYKYKFEVKYLDDNFENIMNQYNQLDKKDKKNCNIYELLYVKPFEIERLPNYKRIDKYKLKIKVLNLIQDVEDNNFEPLVKKILESKQSFHIDGRAGCGKSTLIKLLQTEMKKNNINFISLAPTNKACRIINGQTVHKFVISNNSKSIQDLNIKYLFIDEISMLSELFYNYFIALKQIRKDIKFIIAGDFAQLQPVNERIENANYKDTMALYELIDFNRLQLTKCRRSDDILFNMLLPDNIQKLTKDDFSNHYADRHICFTNKKRITINKYMMDKFIEDKEKKTRSKQLPMKLNKLVYDNNSQDVLLLKDMPIISRKNSKDLGISNNDTFTIKKIDNKKQIIIITDDEKDIDIPIAEFQKMFYIAFCITTHKSQGSTFNHPYTIHEFNLFDERMKYVALSRSTDKNLINIF